MRLLKTLCLSVLLEPDAETIPEVSMTFQVLLEPEAETIIGTLLEPDARTIAGNRLNIDSEGLKVMLSNARTEFKNAIAELKEEVGRNIVEDYSGLWRGSLKNANVLHIRGCYC